MTCSGRTPRTDSIPRTTRSRASSGDSARSRTGQPLQVDQGLEGAARREGRAVHLNPQVRALGEPFAQPLDEPGLPHAGLARDEHGLAATLPCVPPPIEQERELAVASHHRLRGGDPEVTPHPQQRLHLVEANRLRDALERDLAEAPRDEPASAQREGRIAHHDRPWLRHAFDAGGQVGGRTQRQRLFPGAAGVDDDQPRVDADARLDPVLLQAARECAGSRVRRGSREPLRPRGPAGSRSRSAPHRRGTAPRALRRARWRPRRPSGTCAAPPQALRDRCVGPARSSPTDRRTSP